MVLFEIYFSSLTSFLLLATVLSISADILLVLPIATVCFHLTDFTFLFDESCSQFVSTRGLIIISGNEGGGGGRARDKQGVDVAAAQEGAQCGPGCAEGQN